MIAMQFNNLGGGIRGHMPTPTINHNNDNQFATNRLTLREAWNTNAYLRADGTPIRITSPFRAVYNAVDTLARVNYSCGGSCQSVQSKPNVKGIKHRLGAIHNTCDESLIPPAACNTKFVYDASDYIQFKKLLAQNKNYNDRAFGGNKFNAQQSNLRHSKRF